MTPAEDRFKKAVRRLIFRGVYPGPMAIRRELGQSEWRGQRSCGFDLEGEPDFYFYSRNLLNGREMRWRREVCAQMRFKLKGRNLGDPKEWICLTFHTLDDYDYYPYGGYYG